MYKDNQAGKMNILEKRESGVSIGQSIKDPVARETPRIPTTLNILSENLDNLQESLSVLKNRLQPVTNYGGEAHSVAEDSEMKNPEPILLSTKIEIQSDKVKQLNYLVQDMLNLLEI